MKFILLAFMVSVLAIRFLSTDFAARLAMDLPNQRSLHENPVARTGGLGIALGISSGWLFAGLTLPLSIWLGALVLVLVSFLDDRYDLPAALRFLLHGLVAAALVWSFGVSWAWAVVAVLVVVWMTNLYNFMDGADGLAGGMAVFGFTAYAWVFFSHGQIDFGWAVTVIAVAALAFLLFNFPPARIFMGDAGSIPLGFLAAAFGLLGLLHGIWPVWFPLLVFAPFLVDATITLLRRGLRGEKIWQAHKQHYYQRLIQMGWSHRRMALVEYALMLSSAAVAIAMVTLTTMVVYILGGVWVLVLVWLMIIVDRRWARFLLSKQFSAFQQSAVQSN